LEGVPGVDGGDPKSIVDTYRPPEPKKPEPLRVGGDIKPPARTYVDRVSGRGAGCEEEAR
jgi:hypothetical protein